jgi:hypothetical protein
MDSTRIPHHQDINPGMYIFDLATAFMKSRAISAAASLGIADLMASGHHKIDDLASCLDVNTEALSRLMRALASIGIFAQTDPEHYELTAPAMPLLKSAPVSLNACLSMMGDKSWWAPWGDLDRTLCSGAPTINDVLGMDYDSFLQENPEMLATFQACLSSMAKVNNPAILQGYDFAKFHSIVDIGCGAGDLLIDILNSFPQSVGLFYDLAHVVEKINLDDIKPAKRCKKKSGNFFVHIPSGGDLYILKQILHDWNENQAAIILRHCATAMNHKSRLLIIETVLQEEINPQQSMAYFFDLHMLVTSEGKERTVSEFKALLERAQLELENVYHTQSSFSILECRKK